jgi:hypothetical protein
MRRFKLRTTASGPPQIADSGGAGPVGTLGFVTERTPALNRQTGGEYYQSSGTPPERRSNPFKLPRRPKCLKLLNPR